MAALRDWREKDLYLAAFLLSLFLIYFEIFTSRVVVFSVGVSMVYYVISLAILGMSSGAVLASFLAHSPTPKNVTRLVGFACLVSAVSVIVFFYITTAVKEASNHDETVVLLSTGFGPFIQRTRDNWTFLTIFVGAVLAIPFSLVGFVLGILFGSTPTERLYRLCAVDLMGGFVGCVLAVATMELSSFAVPLWVSVALPLLAALFLAGSMRIRRRRAILIASLAISCLVFEPHVMEKLEPKPNLRTISRAWSKEEQPRELWSTWTSHGRISAVEVSSPRGRRLLMSQGNGEGAAYVIKPWIDYGPKISIIANEAKRVLVPLAGAGSDLMDLDTLTHGKAELFGVEIIPQMFEWPKGLKDNPLSLVLQKPNVHLMGAEAREFLLRDTSRYDAILLSYNGASPAYFTGNAFQISSYVYTREGLRSFIEHLTPQGQLTILTGNKIQFILALREFLLGDVRNQMAVLEALDDSASDSESERAWRQYDHRVLVVKPGGFTDRDWKQLRQGYRVVSDNMASVYFRAITEKDGKSWLEEIRLEKQVDLAATTDDRPFFWDSFPVGIYLTSKFWTGEELPSVWLAKRQELKIIFCLAVLGVLLTMAPILIRNGHGKREWKLRGLPLFWFLGMGFMLAEFGLLQKLQLLIGHPGYSLAVVLGSVLLFTGLGNLFSDGLLRKGFLSLDLAALLSCLAIACAVFAAEFLAENLVGYSRGMKLVLAFLIPALPSFFMGQLFPQALARLSEKSAHMVPWALAVNGISGTLAAGFAAVFSHAFGVRFVLFAGAFCYLIVALVLLFQRRFELRKKTLNYSYR